MRTYIQPLKKSAEDEIKVRVDHEVARGLKDYCEFLQSPQSYVVTEVLRKALRKDKAFTAWLSRRDIGGAAHRDATARSKKLQTPHQPLRQSEEATVSCEFWSRIAGSSASCWRQLLGTRAVCASSVPYRRTPSCS